MKFTIQYPSNWNVHENDMRGRVDFRTSEDQIVPIFSIYIVKDAQYLDTDTLTLKNMSLLQYVNQSLEEMVSKVPPTVQYKLIRQYEVTVAGITGIKQEMLVRDSYAFRVNSVIDGRLYELRYIEEQLKVPETLPLVNKMVESFQVIK
jgi:hypothetical protein